VSDGENGGGDERREEERREYGRGGENSAEGKMGVKDGRRGGEDRVTL
jgi:hypothetical protein